ncbi:hypothetical protein NA56DRAFT_744203 [Hyaloscypha hepaticicola]|uniref:Uncharacterized protein n=1 Tax=Hyaloscypha hepaticicola TaxID=2082293 RepID=A0A2J6QL04_9HELO|nr:hypothetical protein NA56DRAFT_744203 [Hyaloscypha hepaticicola]
MFTLFLDIDCEREMNLQGSLTKMGSMLPCQENHDGGLAQSKLDVSVGAVTRDTHPNSQWQNEQPFRAKYVQSSSPEINTTNYSRLEELAADHDHQVQLKDSGWDETCENARKSGSGSAPRFKSLVTFLIEASAYQWGDENASDELPQAISLYKSWLFVMTDNLKDFKVP